MENQFTSKSKAFTFSFEDNICIIEMNDERKSVNNFSIDVLSDLDENLPKILARPNLAGVIFTSTKKNCFAAGADISIFETLKTKEDGARASAEFHRIMQHFASAHVPTIAAIHGVCIGGGLELSLACDYRIATNHSSTQLGLPEVQLGILPGGGGTQRLPRLIGIAAALDLILTGKKIDAKKAQKLGLVDDCVPQNQLLTKALEMCKLKQGKKRKLVGVNFISSLKGSVSATQVALEGNPLGRLLISKQSQKMIQKNTKGHYPAPLKALEAVMGGITQSLEDGLKLEAQLFGELVVSPQSKSLVHVFNIITAAKKNPYDKKIQKEAHTLYLDALEKGESTVGILGAGLMGSGIATVLADKNIRTLLLDREAEGLKKGLKSVASFFEDKFKKRRIKWFERDTKTNYVSPTLSYTSLKNSPLVIEAVYEDLHIKQAVLKQCEEQMQARDFIFATNTSSIPISHIAKTAKNPSHVIGMHFFSPVPKMPLVEIITTDKTSPVVACAVFDLASKMGKQVLVVNDGPGFFTTRILAFQIAEALNILSQGACIEDIDSALESFGMPVGPVTLLDEVGIDVGEHIIQVLMSSFADRMVIPGEVAAIIEEGRKGRKNNKGFYLYKDGKKDKPDHTIYKHFSNERVSVSSQDIVERCVYVFLNEAARCLDEKIIHSEDDGDFGAIFGLGFPPFLGGPFHYAKTLGKSAVKLKLEELAQKYGKRFEPARYWTSTI